MDIDSNRLGRANGEQAAQPSAPKHSTSEGRFPMATSGGRSKVVVTGAAGFIGSHLVEALLDRGHRVIGLDRRTPDDNPTARLNLQQALSHPQFSLVGGDLMDVRLDNIVADASCVYHLAAVPGVRTSWTGFFAYVTANILATERLLDSCRASKVPKVVYASSSSVYGEAGGASREVDATQPISPYGVTKLAGEQLCLAYAKRPGSTLSVTALRYFTVYGPRQRPDMAIGRMLTAALTGEQYTLFGDGTQRREFTFVDDVVSATMAAADVQVPAAVVNVGGGSSVSMIDVIRAVRDVTGNPVPLTASGAQPGDVPATSADLALAHILLGYRPQVDLHTGMSRHATWLRGLSPESLRMYIPQPVTI
ncbi:NAD-dependent epimerase/dehydratase family protein [Actinoplanes sp. NPDC049802]|uniref:NAD-dependent epimerase/dehydratase family protein n=1 Tax=Actinoplanes sp. NPDC049802 TaxID=3154742 RepID=UPI0033D0D5DD